MSDKRDKTQNEAKKPSLYIRTFGCHPPALKLPPPLYKLWRTGRRAGMNV